MFSFVKKQKISGWKAEAETGAKDDQILSLAGVWQLYQTEKPIDTHVELPDDNLFQVGGFY